MMHKSRLIALFVVFPLRRVFRSPSILLRLKKPPLREQRQTVPVRRRLRVAHNLSRRHATPYQAVEGGPHLAQSARGSACGRRGEPQLPEMTRSLVHELSASRLGSRSVFRFLRHVLQTHPPHQAPTGHVAAFHSRAFSAVPEFTYRPPRYS